MTTNLHLELIRCLVNQPGVNVNAQGTSGKTALHYAVESNELALIKLLLAKKDINPFIKDNKGKFPLDYARRREKTEILRTLIDHKYGSDQDSLLHLAAIMNEVNAVRFLIKSSVDVNSKNALLHTPLHLAAGAGHNDVVKILVKEGNAEINVFDARNQTPMHYAVNNKKLWTVKLLLKLGGDVNAARKGQNSMKLSPLHNAVSSSNYDERDLCLDIVRCLINAQSSKVNLQDYENKTPLHYAERLKTIEVLLTREDIDPLVKDDSGKTPFCYAKEGNRSEIIKALISNKYGSEKNSLLHLAAERGDIDLVNAILKEKVDIDVLNGKNQSPIYLAAEKGHLNVVKLLLKRGADHSSTFQLAVKSNNLELMKVLIAEKNGTLLGNSIADFPTFHALNNKYMEHRRAADKKIKKYHNVISVSITVSGVAATIYIGLITTTISSAIILATAVGVCAIAALMIMSDLIRRYVENEFQKKMFMELGECREIEGNTGRTNLDQLCFLKFFKFSFVTTFVCNFIFLFE